MALRNAFDASGFKFQQLHMPRSASGNCESLVGSNRKRSWPFRRNCYLPLFGTFIKIPDSDGVIVRGRYGKNSICGNSNGTHPVRVTGERSLVGSLHAPDSHRLIIGAGNDASAIWS